MIDIKLPVNEVVYTNKVTILCIVTYIYIYIYIYYVYGIQLHIHQSHGVAPRLV